MISALGLNEGAYMAEIVRAGMISVADGQTEAAQSLGHEPAADDAPDRAPAGDPRDHPADRQRDDLDAEFTGTARLDSPTSKTAPGDVARLPVTFQVTSEFPPPASEIK